MGGQENIQKCVTDMNRWAEFNRIFRRVRALLAAMRTLSIRTDVVRWRRVAREVPPWDKRNRVIAGFITANSSVLDLGAGARFLKNYLKEGCSYQPCDVVVSAPDVIYCDFNSGVYPDLANKYDYVVCSGVFEYIRDPICFLLKIRAYGHKIILSYCVAEKGDSIIERLANGWVNHFEEDQLFELFSKADMDGTLIYSGLGTKEIIVELISCTR
jgi:hypothetical protein